MSYRVDIPTLSANEVYTLTFEYGGTETIQLVVGDLTLETTDRRVVFTTTSPVNYIESNMNLTNLNMYEGYYESDDFGGEYTQESYIEGKSLVNLYDPNIHYKQNNTSGLTFGNSSYFQKTITEDGFINCKVLNADAINSSGSAWQQLRTYSTMSQGNSDVFTVILFLRKNNVKTTGLTVRFGYGHPSYEVTEIVKGDIDPSSGSIDIPTGQIGIYHAVVKRGGYSSVVSLDYYASVMEIGFSGDWQNGELEYSWVVLEGDHHDEFVNGEINYFTGIGCVKSPKILSETKHRNIMLNTKPFATTNLITVSDDNTYIYLAEAARYSGLNFKFTQEYLAQHGISNGNKLCIELDGRLIEGTGTQAAKTSTRIGIDACAWSDGSSGLGTVYKNLPENGHYCDYITINGNAGAIGISFLNNPDWTGTNKIYEIQNFRVYKIEDVSEMGTYDCCKVASDDLELYTTVNPNATIYRDNGIADTLDLTTGIVTRNNKKFHFTVVEDRMRGDFYHIDLTTAGYWAASYSPVITNRNITQLVYNSGLPQDGKVYFYIYQQLFVIGCSTWTSFNDAQAWLDEDNGMDVVIRNHENNIKTVQLDISPLKSYRNGSIQTSSQQLAPTLKTTLPISNKFTTTNLTSGSTYNVYFDGTATKLDAGGTIITNPVSPCEVECGGTTLTIEGTDIQNVRVLETTNKNEVGSVNGTTDVELSGVITSDLEVITNDIAYSSNGVSNNNAYEIDNELGTISTRGSHNWGAGYFTTNKKYPKGISLLHVEFDVDMPEVNLLANVYLNNSIPITSSNFRDLTLKNDTATVAQGQSSGAGQKYFSLVTKGHYSRLIYNSVSEGSINIDIYTGASGTTGLVAGGNNAEGSVDGYSPCSSNGVTISNLKIKVIENYPDATSINQITSLLRTNSGLTVIWQDMDMSIGQSISTLEQPIKLRSLGTTYDSYNPATGELTKRIGVSETDGSYSVLSSPIINRVRAGNTDLINISASKSADFTVAAPIGDINDLQPSTTYTLIYDVVSNDGNTTIMTDIFQTGMAMSGGGYIPSSVGHHELTVTTPDTISGNFNYWTQPQNKQVVMDNIMLIQGSYANENLEYFEDSQRVHALPQLYTNGQVKIYSESDVYPTTILNGQSTNNYEINELNKSNNYTIRYDGTCESIILNGKSNEQGTNRIVKTNTNGSGNLTFVNDSGDINNVLLVQNDVREQEINHFNGLQTVEINQLFVSNKQNLFEAYMKNDFEYTTNLNWGTQQYGSLHNGVFKCGELAGGENLQMTWNLIRPHANAVHASKLKEDNPIVLANKVYNISFNISIVDHHTVNGNHSYAIRAYDFDGNEVIPQKATGGRAWLSIGSNGVTNPTPTNFINLDVIFSKDVYCLVLHADYGGAWKFDCTITDFTICEPEYAKPDVPLVYEYIDLPQPVQLNSLPDGTCDTYNPITGEYVQNVGYVVYDDTTTWNAYDKDFYYTTNGFAHNEKFITYHKNLEEKVASQLWNGNSGFAIAAVNLIRVVGLQSKDEFLEYMKQYPLQIIYGRKEPIVTQLTPINIPTFESGILQLITTDGKVFPMIEYSMPTNNRYDTSSWEAGAVYTQRNMTEAYFNESTTPMTPTETMTLTTDHISSGSIILNDNGNGLIVLKGNYTGRDIPYFIGMRSVEAIEVETTPSPDQPLFGKGGRK